MRRAERGGLDKREMRTLGYALDARRPRAATIVVSAAEVLMGAFVGWGAIRAATAW